MKGDDIAKRLLRFSVEMLYVIRRLSTDRAGRHVARQLIRAGTSGGANYEEARIAESRADFVHKVCVAAKEVSESRYWLKLIEEARLYPRSVEPLIQEATELAAILMASAKTARRSAL